MWCASRTHSRWSLPALVQKYKLFWCARGRGWGYKSVFFFSNGQRIQYSSSVTDFHWCCASLTYHIVAAASPFTHDRDGALWLYNRSTGLEFSLSDQNTLSMLFKKKNLLFSAHSTQYFENTIGLVGFLPNAYNNTTTASLELKISSDKWMSYFRFDVMLLFFAFTYTHGLWVGFFCLMHIPVCPFLFNG